MEETVKGFRDFTDEAEKREIIKSIIIENFKKYGFQPAETPIIEYEEFVKGENLNDEAISDIFKLEDKGKRKLALRYEFTFQLKRISKNKKLPYKRYQIGEVFRDEPVSLNRLRQFIQCDADIIGSSVIDEAELISIIKKIFESLGIKFTIYVNNIKLLDEILEQYGIKEKQSVIKEIDKLDKLSEKEVAENLKKYNAEKILTVFKSDKKFFENYPSYKEIEELKNYCKFYGVEIKFLPSLARGLSYYNGNILEVKSTIKETICAGGSYLINGIQSTGISFGLDRIYPLSNIKNKENKILLISIGEDKKTIELAEKLRKNKKNCIVLSGKISKALDYANSYNIDKVIFIGKEEIKKKKFKLKDMKTGKETFIIEKNLLKL